MFCTQCGTKLKDDQKFCTDCGAQVGRIASSTGTSRPSVPPRSPAVGQSPAFRSSPAPAVATSEFAGPIPAARPKPPKVPAGEESAEAAPHKAVSPLIMWGGIGVIAIVVALAVIMFLHSSSQVPDEQIEKSIQAQFASDPDLRKLTIEVRSQSGVVTLTGLVNNNSDRSTASRIVLQQPGAKTVVDDLVVSTAPEAPMSRDQTEIVSTGLSQPGSVKTVPVIGNRPWTDTGVDLNAGEAVSVNASGSISFSRGGQAIGPQGDQPSCAVYGNPRVPYVSLDLRCHSLIGRIGSAGSFFQVGSSRQFRAPVAGRLYLGVNDNFFPDNSGSWTAVISEQSASPGTAIPQQSSNPGTLRLFDPQIDPSARRVVLSGVDAARPSTPFHFDWGDGSESVGFFPQTKIYNQPGTYAVKVVASYPDGSQRNAETTVRIP